MEIWKGIENYEGSYKISSFGNVKSVCRFVKNSNNSKRIVREKILKPRPTNSGYFKVELNINGTGKSAEIHRLVACHFIDNPNKHICVNHKDGNKLNNNKSNLEWCSYRYNSNHFFNGNSKSKHKGICYNNHAKKWQARCLLNNKRYFLGYYKEQEDAAKAYADFCIKNKLHY